MVLQGGRARGEVFLYVRGKWVSQGWVGGGAICIKTRIAASGRIVGKGCMLAWYAIRVHVSLP